MQGVAILIAFLVSAIFHEVCRFSFCVVKFKIFGTIVAYKMLFLAALYCCSLSNFQVLGIYWNYVSGKYPINCTTIKIFVWFENERNHGLLYIYILISSVNQVPLVILTNFLQNKFRSSMVRCFKRHAQSFTVCFEARSHYLFFNCLRIITALVLLTVNTKFSHVKIISKLFPGGQYGVLVLLQRIRSTHVCPPLLPWPDELRRQRKLKPTEWILWDPSCHKAQNENAEPSSGGATTLHNYLCLLSLFSHHILHFDNTRKFWSKKECTFCFRGWNIYLINVVLPC